jgi:hypothetical protein
MPISGLVITWNSAHDDHASALAALQAHPAIELGTTTALMCAIVVDSADPAEDRRIWEWLHALPGVAQVQVAFVGFDDDDSSAPPSSEHGSAEDFP